MKPFAIAIDGPAGSGKGTVARQLAVELGFTYLDTGAMYRAVAWQAQQQQIDIRDGAALTHLAEATQFAVESTDLRINGRIAGDELRTPEVARLASDVAKNPQVRATLVKKQQQIAAVQRVVMEGRDIGTVVLPYAPLKIFLTASIEERARRRYLQLQRKGFTVDLAQLTEEIRQRDESDQNRATSPLKQAEDAILLDSTTLSITEVVAQIAALCGTKMGGRE
jgi:CMP/dCMP kinase